MTRSRAGLLLCAGAAATALLAAPAHAARCALVNNSEQILELRQFTGGTCPPGFPLRSWTWLPAAPVPAPVFDPSTHVLDPPNSSLVVGESDVTETWATPRLKTPDELNVEKDQILANINVAAFRSLCHLKNEIRTKVESLTEWSDAQCLSAFKGLLP